MLAKKLCDKLVVVLKTDERIMKNKHKQPKQSTSERAAILRFLKPIDNIIYMDIDTSRKDIIYDVISLYEGVSPQDVVAIFGSDLKEKEQPFINTDWKDISVVFTYRDEKKMKTVSSSSYQKTCDSNGGLQVFEKAEEAHLE